MREFKITIYTVENSIYSYKIKAEDLNRPREHAKRIITEGYWEIVGDATEIFHNANRIVKVTVKES